MWMYPPVAGVWLVFSVLLAEQWTGALTELAHLRMTGNLDVARVPAVVGFLAVSGIPAVANPPISGVSLQIVLSFSCWFLCCSQSPGRSWLWCC